MAVRARSRKLMDRQTVPPEWLRASCAAVPHMPAEGSHVSCGRCCLRGGVHVSSGCASALKVLSAACRQNLLAASFCAGRGGVHGLGHSQKLRLACRGQLVWPAACLRRSCPWPCPEAARTRCPAAPGGGSARHRLPPREACGCGRRWPGAGQAGRPAGAAGARRRATSGAGRVLGQLGSQAAWPPAGCHSWRQRRSPRSWRPESGSHPS